MPEAEPGVDGTDAAPGASPATPDSEQPTLFSTADAPTTEAVVGPVGAAPPDDEWDQTASAEEIVSSDESAAPPAVESEPEALDAEPGTAEPEPDTFATGVLEIVSALDEDESAAAAVMDAPEAADAAEAAAAEAAVAVAAVGAVGVETVALAVVAPEAPPIETPAPEVPAAVVPADDISPEGAEPPQVEAVPAPAPEGAPSAAAETELPRGRVPWWPFAVYLGLWVVGLGYAVYRLLEVPPGQALYEQVLYGYFVLGGLVLTAFGPILIPFVWLVTRTGLEKSQRGGLFARTAFWGALSTLLGVAMWWITIIALDAVRLGSPL